MTSPLDRKVGTCFSCGELAELVPTLFPDHFPRYACDVCSLLGEKIPEGTLDRLIDEIVSAVKQLANPDNDCN